MIFERIVLKGLDLYSYIVGCPGVNEIAVIDPQRDVDGYLEWAAARGYAITHVFETHIHADFASGGRELAREAGAVLHCSAYDDGEIFDVEFEHSPMKDGDTVTIGGVRIEAVWTPGHTPEHLSFLIYEESRSREIPTILCSGDFVFVGSLGRPDLLGEEAKLGLANKLFDSVQKIREYPDHLEIAPGHGAASMCGGGIGGRSTSTLGFEKLTNPYFLIDDRQEFIDAILGNVPPFPEYYKKMKVGNSKGWGDVNPVQVPGAVGLDTVKADDTVVLDIRPTTAFEAGHIPGAYAIPSKASLVTWASWVLPYDRPIVICGSAAMTEADYDFVYRSLIRVGLDNVVGVVDGGYEAWAGAGEPTSICGAIDPAGLKARLDAGDDITVLDVRADNEYSEGHIDGATHLMAGYLQDQIESISDLKDREVAVICRTGHRSTVASSILLQHGFTRVLNVAGGIERWKQSDLPVEAGEPVSTS
jgi:hydroxyacylglutathione hydrolase